jgi:hypothetical protein
MEADAAVGYHLPLSFGRVVAIGINGMLTVAWMFARSFDSEFIPWVSDASGECMLQTLAADEFVHAEPDVLRQVRVVDDFLCEQSLAFVESVVGRSFGKYLAEKSNKKTRRS